MKRVHLTTTALLATALLAACGDEASAPSGSYGAPIQAGATEKQSATSAVTSTDDLKTLAENDPGDNAAIGKVSGVWGNLNVLVTKKQQEQAMAAQPGGAGAQPGMPAGMPAGVAAGGLTLETLTGALDQSCYSQSGGSVTYNQCDFGTGSIDGTISYTEPDLVLDLTISMSTGASFTITEKGTLTLDATQITGNLSFASSTDLSGAPGMPAGAAGYTSQTTLDATYDVQLTDGCPTGGTLEVHSVTSTSGGQIPAGAGGLDVWVKAEFGPACGDVTLY